MARRADDSRSFAIKSDLHAIGNALEGALPADRLESFRQLVDVGETLVALENLCDNLGDDEVHVSTRVLTHIRKVGEELGLPARYWQRLPST